MGPRASLDDMENRKFLALSRLELRPLGHPAHSQSLYRSVPNQSPDDHSLSAVVHSQYILSYPRYLDINSFIRKQSDNIKHISFMAGKQYE
jgi:hypothetical protein